MTPADKYAELVRAWERAERRRRVRLFLEQAALLVFLGLLWWWTL